jgi:hypothetical protein
MSSDTKKTKDPFASIVATTKTPIDGCVGDETKKPVS